MTDQATGGGLTQRQGAAQRTALLDIPFPAGVSPDMERARKHTIRWLFDLGVLQGDSAAAEFDALRLERLVASFYPEVTGDDLELASDINAWLFMFDDQFDGGLGLQPDAVEQVVETLVRITYEPGTQDAGAPGGPGGPDGPGGSGDNPITAGFRDLWHRVNAGMPMAWQRRYAENCRAYLRSYHREAVNRTGDDWPSFDALLSARRGSIGVANCLDLAERFGRFTLPEPVYAGHPIREMREITLDVVIFVNDLISLDKELAAGERVNNGVLLLQRTTGCSLLEAVRRLSATTNARVARFQQLAASVPAALAAAGAPPPLRAQAQEYVAGMRAIMRGNLEWSLESGRYNASGIAAVSHGRQRPWAGLLTPPQRPGTGTARVRPRTGKAPPGQRTAGETSPRPGTSFRRPSSGRRP